MSVVAEVGVQLNTRRAVNNLRQLESATQKSSKAFNAMGLALKAIPFIGLADATRRFFKGFAEADKARAAVRSLGVDAEVLEKKLLTVSSSLGGLVGQTELTAAAYDVASAGFTDAGEAAEILEASAKGAVGGLSDLNTVADAATSVLNAYGLSSDKAGKLVDGFIQTQNDGKIVVAQYAAQIGRVAPIAAAAGVGIEELNAAISSVTATGVPVESTFAGLRQAVASVIKPTEEAKKTSKALGIEFTSAAIKAKGFGGFLQDVVDKTGGSEVALTKLFGSVEAVATILPLANDNLDSFNQNLENQTNAAGAADKATELLGGTVTQQLTSIFNDVGTLARQLDNTLGPAFKRILGTIKSVTGELVRFLALLGEAPSTFNIFQANVSAFFGAQTQGIDNLKTAVDQLNASNISTEQEAKILEAQANRVRSALDNLTRNTSDQQLENRGLVESISDVALGLDDLSDKIKNVRAAGFESTGKAVEEGTINPLQARVNALLAQLDSLKNKSLSSKPEKSEASESENTMKEIVKLTNSQQLAAARLVDARREENQFLQLTLDKGKEFSDVTREVTDLVTRGGLSFNEAFDLVEANRALKEQVNSVEQINQKQKEIADTIKSNVVGAIHSAIDGSKTLAESFSGLLKDLAMMIVKQKIIGNFASAGGGGLLGLIPGFANGGRPPVGKPSIVGERGPELFVPNTSGTIVPNNKLGGGGATNVVVNVDAKGSSASGDSGAGKQLGGLIGAAVQAELIKQQRPGGLLSR